MRQACPGWRRGLVAGGVIIGPGVATSPRAASGAGGVVTREIPAAHAPPGIRIG
jgi:hypothetical protein